MKTVRYFCTAVGRVQGVGFRMFVQQHAIEKNVTGWVRNMEDGSVTMELQGPEAILDRLLDTIKKGNYFIRVESLSAEMCEIIPDESRFQIRY